MAQQADVADGDQQRTRVSDLARELRIPSWQLLEELNKIGIFAVDDSIHLKSYVVARVRERRGQTSTAPGASSTDELRATSGSRGSAERESTERSAYRRRSEGAGHQQHGATRHDPRSTSKPSPGEIWWARIGFVDEQGIEQSKVRPCIVVRLHATGVDVVQSTSKFRYGHPDYEPLPTYDWDLDGPTECSWIYLGKTIFVQDSNFARRAREFCGNSLWGKIRERFPA